MTFIPSIGQILTQLSSIYGIVNGIDNTIDGVWHTLNNVDDVIIGSVTNQALQIRGSITNISNTIQNKVDSAKSTINNAVNAAESKIKYGIDLAQSAITNVVNNTGNSISSAFERGTNSIRTVIDNTINAAKKWVSDAISFATGAVTGVASSVINAINRTIDTATNAVNRAIQTAKDGITQIANTVQNTVTNAVNRVVDLAQRGFDTAKNALNNAYSAISSSVNSAINQAEKSVNKAYDAITHFIDSQSRQVKSSVEDFKTFIRTDIIAPVRQYSREIEAGWRDFSTAFSRFTDKWSYALSKGWGVAVVDVPNLLSKYKFIVDKIMTNQYSSFDELLNDLSDLGVNVPLLSVMIQILISIPLLLHLLITAASPFAANVQTLVATEARPTNMDVGDAVAAFYRGLADIEFVMDIGAKNGLPDEQIKLAILGSQPKLDPIQLRDLYLRGEISEEYHDSQLKLYALTDEQIRYVKVLYFFIPPPQDLITMSVREVFSPEIAEKFGQFEDFPRAFADWAKKIGISEEWAKNYWAMHWGLPSPQMGFEMLHRDIIDTNELRLLLKSLDIMPFWRDKLIQLSYNVFTRVDTRRMYELGVLDEQGVLEEYMAQGYNMERAKKLTEYTILYVEKGEKSDDIKLKDLTQGVIKTAYAIGEMDRQEAVERLGLLGTPPPDANLILDIVDYDNTRKDSEQLEDKLLNKARDLAVSAYKRGSIGQTELTDMLQVLGVKDSLISLYISVSDYEIELELKEALVEGLFSRYYSGHITEAIFRDTLANAGFTQQEIVQAVTKADRVFEFRAKKPTQERLERWAKKGIITPDDYAVELSGLGFDERYTAAYMVDAGLVPGE